MAYWYSPSEGYHEGDAVFADDQSVPQRPDATCQWVNGAWTASTAAKVEFIATAQSALDKVTGPSGTIIRCVVAGVAVPAAWTAYVAALRAIVNGSDTTSTALPKAPAYPAGT